MESIQTIFKRASYPAGLAALFDAHTTMPLGSGQPRSDFEQTLRAAHIETVFAPQQVRDAEAAHACLSGLWLFHNFIEQSHRICQALDTAEGSYWHAIVHRREPDFWNSKYWFRRVGRHAIFAELCRGAAALAASHNSTAGRFLRGQKEWDASAFVDLCEACIDTGTDDEKLCEHVQMLEWHLLFAHCFRAAAGG